MTSIGNYTVDITVTLQDGEVADILGIDNDDAKLNVAYDAINWDGIEDKLTELAKELVCKQAKVARDALVSAGLCEPSDAEDDDCPCPEFAEDAVLIRFSLWEKGRPAWDSKSLDVDIRPALDEIPAAELPEWADEFDEASCDCGTKLFLIGQRLGIVPEWEGNFSYDGIDCRAYERYLDDRRQSEGLLTIERY